MDGRRNFRSVRCRSPTFTSASSRLSRGSAAPREFDGRPDELPDPIPFRDDRADEALRCRRGGAVLPRSVGSAPSFSVSYRLYRESQSGPSVLGKLRSRGDAFLRASRAGPPRRRPVLPDDVTREAYSHEVSSAGFWPGDAQTKFPAFYSYAYPAPKGFAESAVGAGGSVFRSEARRVRAAVRSRADVARPRGDAHGFPREHLSGRGRPRAMGLRRPRMPHRRTSPTPPAAG